MQYTSGTRQWVRALVLSVTLGLMGWHTLADAASKQYVSPETPITFGDSGTTENLDFASLANAAGRLSSYVDRGAGSHAVDYLWRCTIQVSATVVVGTTLEVYLATADVTTVFDGEVSITDTADAALTTDKRNNLKLLGLVIADQTAAATDMTASGFFQDRSRYLALGIWNATGVALSATANISQCSLTPVPVEQQ
jgi:hypothetical protein